MSKNVFLKILLGTGCATICTHSLCKWLSFNTETCWQQGLTQKLFGRGATDSYAERGNDDLRCAGEMFTTFNTLIKTFLKHYQDIGFDYVCQVCNSFLRIDMMKKEWKSMRGIISRIQRKRRKMWQLRKFQTYVPRGTLRSSQNHHLSKRFCDRVLFDYVSFIRLLQETKAFVSIIGVISVVKYIANSLKL